MASVHHYNPARELALFFAAQYVGEIVEEYPTFPYRPEDWHDIDQSLLAQYRKLGADVLTCLVLSGRFQNGTDAAACSMALLVEHQRNARTLVH